VAKDILLGAEAVKKDGATCHFQCQTPRMVHCFSRNMGMKKIWGKKTCFASLGL
jgi:hypothetical protein